MDPEKRGINMGLKNTSDWEGLRERERERERESLERVWESFIEDILISLVL